MAGKVTHPAQLIESVNKLVDEVARLKNMKVGAGLTSHPTQGGIGIGIKRSEEPAARRRRGLTPTEGFQVLIVKGHDHYNSEIAPIGLERTYVESVEYDTASGILSQYIRTENISITPSGQLKIEVSAAVKTTIATTELCCEKPE
jgi:hypothetical protein